MKRELAFALEAHSQLNCESLGRTRSSKPQFSPSNSPVVVVSSGDNVAAETSQCNGGLHVYTRQKRFKAAKLEAAESVDGVVVENEIPDVMVTPKRFTRSALKPIEVGETDVKVDDKEKMVIGGAETETETEVAVAAAVVDLTCSRRFTRSALKPEVMEVDGDLNLDDLDGGKLGSGNESGAGTPMKLELKMSKKIELPERITTVRELLETGLLEGYPVFYNFGKEGTKLRGVIKGVGILCSCTSCKGSKVILPSQFEIHACRTYKRASQYICLENGKSLLQLLEICKSSAMETLEETIQTVIGQLPVDKMSRTSKSAVVSEPLTSTTLPVISRKNSESKRKRNSLGPELTSPSARRASQCDVSHVKMQRKMKKNMDVRSSRSEVIPKSPGSASASVSRLSRSQTKISKGVSKSASVSRSSACTSQTKSKWKITKKDQNMHRLVFEEGGLPDGTEVGYYSRGKKLLEGYKKGLGIYCLCCNAEVSASQFEAHAGWASRKKPYGYIYTSNGVSLHEYAISLLKHRECPTKENDDLCIVCRDGGNLLLCDGCPRAFHKDCASLPSVPRGKWYCHYCENMFQRERFVEHNANAIAAGRVSGVDPIEEITNRCIRIVKNPENVAVACLLCRGYEFSKDSFGPTTVILCDQCEKEYHVGCLKKNKMANLKQLPKGKWYCSKDCKKMRSDLKDLIKREPQILPDNLMDLMRKKQIDSGLNGITDSDVIRWSLLNGQVTSRQTKSLLSEAVAIFHECFNPIVDAESGKDFIPAMVYCGDIRGQYFGGMYSAVLTVNSVVVSAGILRVFGQDMAELPLVATSKCNQGKGYFQILFSCIEKLLISLNVKRIILPSADEAEAIWIKKFGFSKLSPQQLAERRKACTAMIIFKGTSMLEKELPVCQAVKPDATSSDLSVE